MIKKIRKQPIWYTLMTIAIFAFAVFFLCKCCMHLLQFPGAVNEYREAADVQLTQAFLDGDNPYRLQSIEQERDMPPVLYQYSFLNSLLCAGIALLLGGRVILAHYILALLAMIGSGILTYCLIDRYSQQTVVPMLGATLMLFCHWRSGYVSTTPNSLGIFLSLLAFTVAVSPRIKKKAILTAFLCVLLFYTKLYFVTIAGAIFIFCLFYDRREVIKFVAMCILQGALSILIIQWFWPLYYTYNLYFINGGVLWNSLWTILKAENGYFAVLPMWIRPDILNINFSEGTRYVFVQYGYLITVFFPLFAILFFSLVTAGIQKRKIHVEENDVLGFAVIAMITQGLCLFVVGRENGAYLSYFLQLWIPYVIIAGLSCLEKYLHLSRKMLNVFLIAVVALLSLYFGFRRLPLHMMTEQEMADWQQAAAYIDQYEDVKSEGNKQGQLTPERDVYYTPILAYLAIEHGKWAYNNGHVGALEPSVIARANTNTPAQVVFPHADRIIELHDAYRSRILENIENHTYKLITTDSDALLVDEEVLLANGYHLIDTLPLVVGNAEYEVGFYTAEH